MLFHEHHGFRNLLQITDFRTARIPVSYTHLDVYKRQVIEVKLDTGKCQMADLLIILPAFLQLRGEFILAFGGCCHLTGILAVIHHILHPVDLGFIYALHLVHLSAKIQCLRIIFPVRLYQIDQRQFCTVFIRLAFFISEI